jgi:hypothetical protein
VPSIAAFGGPQLSSDYVQLRRVVRLLNRKKDLSLSIPDSLLAEHDRLQRLVRGDKAPQLVST